MLGGLLSSLVVVGEIKHWLWLVLCGLHIAFIYDILLIGNHTLLCGLHILFTYAILLIGIHTLLCGLHILIIYNILFIGIHTLLCGLLFVRARRFAQ